MAERLHEGYGLIVVRILEADLVRDKLIVKPNVIFIQHKQSHDEGSFLTWAPRGIEQSTILDRANGRVSGLLP